VALLVANPSLHPKAVGAKVLTTQIAPTILLALGLDPDKLQAVEIDGTHSLPGLGFGQ
jgi:hypothetical protein